MDLNDLRSLMTVVSLLTFVGIVLWAWSSRRKAAFDEAARLVFDEEDEFVKNRPAVRR
ncbi:cbb3-type cytochrome oxidase subunit 3 [Thiobacter aerophilum]|uniref:Cbb3-type cytochrome c oxidase subunit 3 n=1 Tax=Thiobacter aerophilum TaxID=3121275 RepID=A0ABV0EC06_9BURK